MATSKTAAAQPAYLFAHAYAKGTDSQPRKTAIVAALVRDRYLSDALVILEHTPRRAARAVSKAVASAQANLLNLYPNIDPQSIVITKISVTAGTRFRRYVPASRGRALPFEKVSSNIYVEVAGLEDPERVKAAAEAAKKAAADKEADKKASDKKASAKPATTKKEAAKPAKTASANADTNQDQEKK